MSGCETGIETITDERTDLAKKYKVLLHNDDSNDMGHVVVSLTKVFNFEKHKCMQLMLEAHSEGIALCKIVSKEKAELFCEQLLTFGLIGTMEES